MPDHRQLDDDSISEDFIINQDEGMTQSLLKSHINFNHSSISSSQGVLSIHDLMNDSLNKKVAHQ